MSERRIEFQVEGSKVRLDKLLGEQVPELSRSAAQKLIGKGLVTVDGEIAKPSHKVRQGEEVVVLLPAEQWCSSYSSQWILRCIP